jgi:Winged helix DNA-binding domain
VRRVTWGQVCARRLRRHGLVDPVPALTDAARAVCGMHAQVMSAAEVALGIRTRGTTRRDVREALWTRRELVKTYGPRGTVHLVPAADLAAWCAALTTLPWATTDRPPEMRLTQAQTDVVVAAVDATLTEGDRTVEELDAEIVARTGPWAGDLVIPAFDGWWPRWRQAIGTAAYRGVLCFGPDRGRRTSYTHPRRWVPGFQGPDGAGPGSLVLAYLGSYGPATPDYLAQWLGVPGPRIRGLVAGMGDRLVEVELDGVLAYLPAGDSDVPDERATGVRLLPYFDPYVVGCHPRASLFPEDAGERALTRGQAGTRPVLLVDGTVAGVWHQRRSGRRVHVTVEPFRGLSPGRRGALDAEVERLGEILEATPALTIGTVTAGRHL